MPFKDLSFCGKIKFLCKQTTLEPVCFIFALNFGFYAIASTQLYVEKMCTVNMNLPREVCDNIQNRSYVPPPPLNRTEIQSTLQEKTTRLKWQSKVIQAVPPLFYSLIAGPWCDKHGRKPLIIISIFGYAIANTVFLINTIWWYELKAEYILFECLQDLSGGSALFYLGTYSMYADLNKGYPKEYATIRLALVDGLIYLGFYVGNAAAAPIKAHLGFTYNFAFGILTTVIAAAYMLIFIPETLVKPSASIKSEKIECDADKIDTLPDGWEERINDDGETFYVDHINEKTQWEKPLNNDLGINESNGKVTNEGVDTPISNEKSKSVEGTDLDSVGCFKFLILRAKEAVLKFVEGFHTVLKKRFHNGRFCLLMLITAFILEMFSGYGWSNFFMYYRLKLQFTMSDFSILMSIGGVCGLAGQFIFVPLFTKSLGFHAAFISLLDAFTCLIKTFIIVFVKYKWMLYLGSGIGFLDSTTTTVMRSMIIGLVPVTEIGKVFSVVEFFKGLLAFAGPIIYGVLYEKTVRTVPEAFLYLITALKCLVLIASVIIYVGLMRYDEEKKKQNYSHKKDDQELSRHCDVEKRR